MRLGRRAARAVASGEPVVRVGLFGEFGCGNLGNEASLTAGIDWFSGAGHRVVLSVFARETDYVEVHHHLPAVRIYGVRPEAGLAACVPRVVTLVFGRLADQYKFFRSIGDLDLVIVPGMGILETELGGPPWGLPMTLFGAALLCRLRGVPFALLAIGAGNDPRPMVRRMNRTTLRAVSHLSFRDALSKNALRAQGARIAEAPIFPDVAFGLPSARRRTRPSGVVTVGIGVLSFYNAADPAAGEATRVAYERAMTTFAASLLDESHYLRILIGDMSDDEVAGRMLAELRRTHPGCDVDGRVRYVVVSEHEQLQQEIEHVDVVVAARYHNLVFALKSGCPAISVSYAPKCTVLLSGAGFPSFTHRVETLDPTALGLTFGDLMDDYDAVAARTYAYAGAAAALDAEHRQWFFHRIPELAGRARLIEE